MFKFQCAQLQTKLTLPRASVSPDLDVIAAEVLLTVDRFFEADDCQGL